MYDDLHTVKRLIAHLSQGIVLIRSIEHHIQLPATFPHCGQFCSNLRIYFTTSMDYFCWVYAGNRFGALLENYELCGWFAIIWIKTERNNHSRIEPQRETTQFRSLKRMHYVKLLLEEDWHTL